MFLSYGKSDHVRASLIFKKNARNIWLILNELFIFEHSSSNVSRVNTLYSLFLIIIGLVLFGQSGFVLSNTQEYAALIMAGFGLVLLPISGALKRKSKLAKLISLILTSLVGIFALILLLRVHLTVHTIEPSLLLASVASFILVGFYLHSLRKPQF